MDALKGNRRKDAAHGKALLDLVFFQLGEYGEDPDHRPAERGGGVKVLADGNEIDAAGHEFILDQHEGVFLAPGQAVQFVDYHHVNKAGADVRDHLLERGPVGIAAGIAAVGVEFYDGDILRPAERPQPVRLFFYAVIFQLAVRRHPDVTCASYHGGSFL